VHIIVNRCCMASKISTHVKILILLIDFWVTFLTCVNSLSLLVEFKGSSALPVSRDLVMYCHDCFWFRFWTDFPAIFTRRNASQHKSY
jgi:hypothetical protein